MRRIHRKSIFLIIIFLIISISSKFLVKSYPNHDNYSINKNKIGYCTEEAKNDKELGNIQTSDNPGNFTLTTDKNIIYVNRNITFFWTSSEGADNYSLYISAKNITKIDGNCTLIAQGLTRLNYSVRVNEVGVKYYVIVAYNESGSTLSNCVKVFIVESSDADENGKEIGDLLSGPLIFFLIIGIVVLLSITIIITYREKKRHFFRPPPEPFSHGKDEDKEYQRIITEEIRSIKKPKSAREILDDLINNEKLLDSLNQEKFLEKFELSSISPGFLNKIDKFNWTDEIQKIEFIREMLALTPEDRDDILNYMMERSENEDLSV